MIRFMAVLSLLLAGCNKHDERTPAGWKVTFNDEGSVSTGIHTKAEIYALFDAAMVRSFGEAADTLGYVTAADVEHRAREYDTLYHLVDNAWFEVGPNAWAAGMVTGRHHMYVAMYNLNSVLATDYVPFNGLYWTIHPGVAHPDRVYYGEEIDGQQFPALAHELLHMWGVGD